MNIGIIGAGNISGIYLSAPKRHPELKVVAIADLDSDKARARAAEYGVAKVCTVEELLAAPEVDLVVNLTVPGAHAQIALAALAAGKYVYNEKPLAVSLSEARQMLNLARERGLRVGGAPDTFLGGGLQTGRELVDAGAIGAPVAATAFFLNTGPESWHPDPAFFFREGAGPLFDMGPYYLTALVNLFGPVARVSAHSSRARDEREVGSGPRQGERIQVETPTHVAGLLEFRSGVTATLVTSFDAVAGSVPNLEVYGSEGALTLPDPNTFGGPLRLRGRDGEEREVAVTRPFTDNSRGLGVADMARAIEEGRPHRASGELALHVLEVMHAVLQAAREGRAVEIESAPERPAPLEPDFDSAPNVKGQA